ncbi:hypothetical protein D9611_012640 [Ephemerocybe angulata]|uniref:Uncharacterized protein n=1 Tax=Ephemerocybe angulata TaxID=980116 RepID=A0A8H5AUQ2_9AGAR|nr:hypothetical protein D9611_012640 [Tulosesus angulatus]
MHHIAFLQRLYTHPGHHTPMNSPDVTGPVGAWLKRQFQDLYAPNEDATATIGQKVQGIFTEGPEIRYNHEKMDLRSFQENLESSQFAVKHAEIEWRDLLEEKVDEKHMIVAGFFGVKRLSTFRVRVGPAERHQQISFSAKIENSGGVDGSRISELFISSSHKAAPIHLQPIPGQSS